MNAHGAASGTMGLNALAPLPAAAQPVAALSAVAQLPRPHPLLATPRRVLRMRSDDALAERFRAGDQEAFSVLYERHRASVLAVCIGVLGSRHDAEDAAQDAFASLAVALRTNPPRDLRPWLARVARNAAIDVVRRRRAVTPADETVEGEAAASTEVRAELQSVLAGLRELPESQRTALLMRELAGHSYLEIGALLELDESAVRGLISRGRIGLRAHREATEMPCAAAREALATEPDGRHRDRTMRRHLRSCAACKAYGHGLRQDARSLRAVLPASVGGVAGGSAIFGGFAAKTVLTGGVLSQVTAACAVSVCAVGGIALLYPHALGHHAAHHSTAAPAVARPQTVGGSATHSAQLLSLAALRRALSGAAGAGARGFSGSAALAGSAGSAAKIRIAPIRASKVVSAASVLLTRRFRLPGSQQGGATTGTGTVSPPGAMPTSPTPGGNVPAPTRWGGSSTGYSSAGWGDSPGTAGSGSGSGTGSGHRGPGSGSSSGTGAGYGDRGSGTGSGYGGSGSGTGSGYGGSGSGPGTSSPTGTGTRSGTGTGTSSGAGTGSGSGTGTGSTGGTSPASGTGGWAPTTWGQPSGSSAPSSPGGFW